MKSNFFKNKNILIFGATSGIGMDLSLLLDEMNSNLILIGRNKKDLEFLKKKTKNKKNKIFVCDLNKEKDIEDIFKQINNLNLKIDGLVFAAGVHFIKPIQSTSIDDLNNSLKINFIAPYLVLKNFSSNFSRSDESSVVLISSITAFVGQTALTAYSSSKGAIVSLTKSAAVELARKKIRVNCIAPGHIKNTKMSNEVKSLLSKEQYDNLISKHPLGVGSVRDVSDCIIYLLSDSSKWVTGTTIRIDGGFSLN